MDKTKCGFVVKAVVCPDCGRVINLQEVTDWLAQQNLVNLKKVM